MTIGIKLGRAAGFIGASVQTAAERSFAYSGQFGRDVVQGTKDGYADRRAALAQAKAAIVLERKPEPATAKRAAKTAVAA